MSKETAARMAVRDTLIELVDINRRFKEQVTGDEHLPVWVMKDLEDTRDDRAMAAEVSTRLTYVDSQNKQETARLPGIIGISRDTAHTGSSLNLARDSFKKAMSEYRKLYGDSN